MTYFSFYFKDSTFPDEDDSSTDITKMHEPEVSIHYNEVENSTTVLISNYQFKDDVPAHDIRSETLPRIIYLSEEFKLSCPTSAKVLTAIFDRLNSNVKCRIAIIFAMISMSLLLQNMP